MIILCLCFQLAWMESPLSNVQVESEQSSLHTKQNLKKTHPSSPPPTQMKRGDALHDTISD
jgi:hypothetical protein